MVTKEIKEAAARLVAEDLALQAQGKDLPESAYAELDALLFNATGDFSKATALGVTVVHEAYIEAGV